MYIETRVCQRLASRLLAVYKMFLANTFVSAHRYGHGEPGRKRKTLEELASSGGSDFVESRKRVLVGRVTVVRN